MKKNIFLLLLLLLIAVVALLGVQSFMQTQTQLILLSKQNQKDKLIALFDNFIMSRSWNNKIGRVFVQQQKGIQPKPYLQNNHLYTVDGELLINVNPSWIMRQIIEMGGHKKGYQFNITSLVPLNPENKADDFETKALIYLQSHKDNPYYFHFADGFARLDFMGALTVTQECLKCHGKQGYQNGDVHGGIRISVPTELLQQQIQQIKYQTRQTVTTIIAIVVLIFILICWLTNSIFKRHKEIHNLNDSLNNKVTQRTRSLQVTQKQLTDELQFQKMRAELYNLLISSDCSQDQLRIKILNNARQLLDSPFALAGDIDPLNADLLCQYTTHKQGGDKNSIVLPADNNGHYPKLWGHTLHTLQAFNNNQPVKQWLPGSMLHWKIHLDRVLSVPVMFNDNLVGQLAVANKVNDYTARDSKLLQRLANFYALSMHFLRTEADLKLTRKKEQQYLKEVKRLSITDPLTSLYNRRHFKELFVRRLNSAKRLKLYFGLMIIDIDHFKLYNDHYGHLEGDRALISTAQMISQQMRRSTEQAFRVGGEEFSCLILSEKRKDIVHLAESIRLAVKESKIEHLANPPSQILTVSVGLEIVSGHQDMTFDTIYKAADDALYQAKDQGRDQVCIA